MEGEVEGLLGYAAEELLSGRISLFDRIHPADCNLTAELWSGAKEPVADSFCLRFRHADGRIRCLQANCATVEMESEPLLELQLQDARALSSSSDRGPGAPEFQALLEHSDEVFFHKDRNHVFAAASPKFREELEPFLQGRELVGLTDYDFLDEALADSFYGREAEVLSQDDGVQDIFEMPRPEGGSGIWVQVRQYPVKGPGGATTGILSIVRFLTERVGDRNLLIQDLESLKESQRISGIGCYLLDLRTGSFAASGVLDSILGMDPNYPHTVEGWLGLVHPDDRARMLEHFTKDVLQEGKLFDSEYRTVRPSDKATRWVHGLGRVEFDWQKNPLLMRGTIQDITERKQAESALKEAGDRLRLFIEEAPAGLAMFDREMRYLAVSRRWLEIHSQLGQNVLGRSHYDVEPNVPEHWKECHRRGMAGEAQRCDEDRFENPDGSIQWISWEIQPWHQEDGSVGGIVLGIEDITSSHKAEERLRLTASVFEHASEAIVVTDLEEHILEVNERFTHISGYRREEVLGLTPCLLLSGQQPQLFFDDLWNSVHETGRWSGEIWCRAKNGSLFATMTTITTVLDATGKAQYYLLLSSDITPIKEQERQLQHVSHFDALTGLPNRALLVERLRKAMAYCANSGQRLALAYFDLDAFKAINDVHGHAIADRLLVTVAAHIKRTLRDGDILARISGDEFVVALADLHGTNTAGPLLARVLRAISDPVKSGSTTLQITASAGVTFYPQTEDVDADQLLRQADLAMYAAKLAGGNRCHFFDPEQDRSTRGRHEELDRIRQALEAREFVLYYQPKVNMTTGELMGAEALIRWQHPERGLLPPALFLPLIEEHDLAIKIGEWVLDTALSQVERWAAEGKRLAVSVNVGARQLQQPDFVDRLETILQAHPAVSPSFLELEVLESSALEDVAMVSRVIESCRKIGLSVAIDDFGTGYSSLTYLKRLPATVLKIDQSFVRDMLDDPDDLAILQGVMGLATAFRRTPVAEGVETVGHGVLLLKLGCQLAQGYGIARPMPGDDLLGWHETWCPDPRWKQAVAVNQAIWPIMVAEVALGAWHRTLEEFVAGERANPPELDETRCRFAAWFAEERAVQAGRSPIIDCLDILHSEMHRLAKKAVELKMGGNIEEAKALVVQASVGRDQIYAQLSFLMQAVLETPDSSAVDLSLLP